MLKLERPLVFADFVFVYADEIQRFLRNNLWMQYRLNKNIMNYILQKDYETPCFIIRKGVVKTEPEWIKDMPRLQKGDCDIKKDWFKKEEPKMSIKPPLGLMPMQIWIEERLQDIDVAIKRYNDANIAIPKTWVCERETLLSWSKNKESVLNEETIESIKKAHLDKLNEIILKSINDIYEINKQAYINSLNK